MLEKELFSPLSRLMRTSVNGGEQSGGGGGGEFQLYISQHQARFSHLPIHSQAGCIHSSECTHHWKERPLSSLLGPADYARSCFA